MSNSQQLEQVSPANGRLHRAGNTLHRRPLPSVSTKTDEDEITLGFLLRVWNHWWKLLIPVSLLLAIASSAIVVLTFEPKFRADARLEIAEQSPWVVYRDDEAEALRFVETQIEMLRSPRVLSAALAEPRIAAMPDILSQRDPVTWLMNEGLEIKPVGESVFVSVAYEGPNPETAALLVNTVIDRYFKVQDDQKNLRAQKILNILIDEKNRQEAEVTRLQDRVKFLGKNLPDTLPNMLGMDVSVSQARLQELFEQTMAAQLEAAMLESEVEALREAAKDGSPIAAEHLVQARINSLPDIQAKILEIQGEEAKLPGIEVTAKEGKASPLYLSQLSKIERLKSDLEVARETAYESAYEQVMASSHLERQELLGEKQTALKAKQRLLKSIDARYKAKRDEMASEGGARLEFDFAQQELEQALAGLTLVSERSSQMTSEMVAPGRSEIYRRATPPEEPVQKYPIIGLIASIAGSLAIPFAIAFLWENSVRRISTVEQLETSAELGVVGEISRLPARRGQTANGSRLMGHELGMFEESIDSLRTSLLLSNEEHDVQVLAVASAVSGEGKTSVASQLAVSIARATGQPVLLIDGDMRKPDIHQIFEVPLSPGLADVLDDATRLDEAINRSWSEHVHILPAGELTKSPHKLLGTGAFRSVLDEARLWYRHIVVDTPPILAASESLVIAKHADGTLVCSMRDFSRSHHVRLAHRRLEATGAVRVGTVLNGVPVHTYAYRYGSYGRYGYVSAKKS